MQSISFILKELVFVKLHENWKKTTHKSVSSLPKGIAQNNALIMKEFRSFHTTTGPSQETKAHTSIIGNKGLPGSLPTTLNKLQACCCQDAEKMRNTIYLRTNYWSCAWASFFTTTNPFPEIKAHTGLIGNKGLPHSLTSTLNELQAHCCQDPQQMRCTIYLVMGYWSTVTWKLTLKTSWLFLCNIYISTHTTF